MPQLPLLVGFLAGSQLSDHLIRATEQAQHPDTPLPLATHCALFAGRLGIEAVWPKVHLISRRTFGQGSPIRWYPVPLPDGRAAWQEARRRLGEPYNLWGLLRVGWYVLTGRAGSFYGDHKATVFCSQLIVECLRAGGYDPLPGLPATDVTPAALEAALLQRSPAWPQPATTRP